ncbi:MAG: hypothetical protein IT381_12245 [Deltaproteobacteria bacterium]|nr:hypothetical protein [Deltaproteobacteria bacterium]
MTITKVPQGTSGQPMSVEPPPQDKTPPKTNEKKSPGETAKAEAQPGAQAKKTDGVSKVAVPNQDELVTLRLRTMSDTGVVVHDAPPVAPPTSDGKLQAALDLFNGLAAQLGQAQGTPAAKFAASVAVPKALAGLPELALGREQTQAIVMVHTLVAQGAIKLPAAMQQKLDARFALVTSPPPSSGTVPLTPAQQQAAQRIAAAFLPVLRGMQGTGRVDARTAMLMRFDPRRAVDVEDDAELAMLPAPMRRALSLALGIGGDEPGGAEATGGAQRQVSDADETGSLREDSGRGTETAGMRQPTTDAIEGRQRTGESDLATLDPITVPGPEVIAFEKAIGGDIFALAGADVEMLCQIMMMELARDAEVDLRETLNDMKKINDEKAQMREHIAAAKEQATAMKSALRSEYDRRCALPKGPPGDHIDASVTSFDDYCASQKLSLLGGSLAPDGDSVVPTPPPEFGISPNTTRYPQATEAQETWNGYTVTDQDRAVADRLGIDATQATALRRTWDNDPKLQAKFSGSFEEWIVRSQDEGGVGLTVGGTESQKAAVTLYLARHDPAVVTDAAASKYSLSQEQMTTLYQHYTANLSEAERQAAGGTFDTWLANELGMRPGMQRHNTTQMNQYLAGFETDADMQRMMDVYGVAPHDLHALHDVYNTLDDKPATFEEFLTSAVGLSESNVGGNDGRVGTYFYQLAVQASTPAAAAAAPTGPPEYTERDAALFDQCCDAAQGHVPTDSNTYSPEEQYILDTIAAIEESVPAAVKAQMEEILSAVLRSLFASTAGGGGDKGAQQQPVIDFLTKLVDAQDANGMITALNEFAANGQFANFSSGAEFANACHNLASQLRGSPELFDDVHEWFRGRTIICQNDLVYGETYYQPRGNENSWMSDRVLHSAQGSGARNHVLYASYSEGWHLSQSNFTTARSALDSVFANLRGAERERGPSEPEEAPPAPPLSDREKDAIREIAVRRREAGLLEDLMASGTAPPPPDAETLNRPLNEDDLDRMQELERQLGGAIFAAIFGSEEAIAMLQGDSPQMREFWELKYRRAHELGVETQTPEDSGDTFGRDGRGGLSDLSAEQRAAMEALRTAPQTNIDQPSQVGGLREMSLEELNAYIDEWKDKKESKAELGEEISLKIQMQQDRRAKAFTTLSNLLKKWSDTSGAIIANMK